MTVLGTSPVSLLLLMDVRSRPRVFDTDREGIQRKPFWEEQNYQ